MSKTVLIILVFIVLLFMGAVGAGFFILWTKIDQIPKDHSAMGAAPVEEEVTLGPLHTLDTMIVNLADRGGKRYLRVTMALELSDSDALPVVEERLPQIRDAILMILPTKNYGEISTTDGKVALREQLKEKINALLAMESVTNIYFTEFVVQ
jgi:flagellar FliL protein